MTALFRRLLLLRHGQAGHPQDVRDYDRPLSPEGENEADEVGTYLSQENLLPALALVSGSQRTRATWSRVQRALPEVVSAIFDDRIYEARSSTLRDVLRGVLSEPPTLLLVGHNPGLHRLALELIGRGGQTAYGRLTQELPPAGLVVIDFEVAGWGGISDQGGALERFVTPKK
ncbi:MAG: histidine phosphatase family protein [Burkholderiaceae bacterium]|nr:MAG: histidine phosphatase family protein [Burkholderiaceae bacterium]